MLNMILVALPLVWIAYELRRLVAVTKERSGREQAVFEIYYTHLDEIARSLFMLAHKRPKETEVESD